MWSPTSSNPTSPTFNTNSAPVVSAAGTGTGRPRESTISGPSVRIKYQGRRFGQIVKLKPEYLEEYKACHKAVWPEVLKQIKECNIEDYSIFYDDLSSTLFASFKYVGYDYAGDMEKMRDNPKVREWWKMTDGYQESLVEGAVSSESGEPSWWKPVEEVFYAP